MTTQDDTAYQAGPVRSMTMDGISFSETIMVDINDLNPAPENEQLYRKISSEDPEIIELASSIEQDGIIEPLVITEDRYILSGHRRAVAADLAGLWEVPARTVPITHDDPRFVKLLREFNRQRLKGVDEILHETLIDIGADELQEYRQRVREKQMGAGGSCGQVEITAGDEQKRHKISVAKEPFAKAIIAAVQSKKEFWPISARSVHYTLLNHPPLRTTKTRACLSFDPESMRYANDSKSYNDLLNILLRLRLIRRIPWEAITDPTRPAVQWTQWENPAEFIRKQVSDFMDGYSRNWLQSQPAYIEVVAEKLTIGPVIRPACAEFGMPYLLTKGYASGDARYKLAERFRASGKDRMILLIITDLDPDGETIAQNYIRSLRDDFNLWDVTATKIAVTGAQRTRYRLPPGGKAKPGSSRYKEFVKKYGDEVFELESLDPSDLQDILKNSIRNALDLDLFNAEIEAEEADLQHILQTKAKAVKLLAGLTPGTDAGGAV